VSPLTVEYAHRLRDNTTSTTASATWPTSGQRSRPRRRRNATSTPSRKPSRCAWTFTPAQEGGDGPPELAVTRRMGVCRAESRTLAPLNPTIATTVTSGSTTTATPSKKKTVPE
jgi:hypothetical protein